MSFASGVTAGIPVGIQSADVAGKNRLRAKQAELYDMQLKQLNRKEAQEDQRLADIEAVAGIEDGVEQNKTQQALATADASVAAERPATAGPAQGAIPNSGVPAPQGAIPAAPGAPAGMGSAYTQANAAPITVRDQWKNARRAARRQNMLDPEGSKGINAALTQSQFFAMRGLMGEAANAAQGKDVATVGQKLNEVGDVLGQDLEITTNEDGTFNIPILSDKPVGMDKIHEFMVVLNQSPEEAAAWIMKKEEFALMAKNQALREKQIEDSMAKARLTYNAQIAGLEGEAEERGARAIRDKAAHEAQMANYGLAEGKLLLESEQAQLKFDAFNDMKDRAKVLGLTPLEYEDMVEVMKGQAKFAQDLALKIAGSENNVGYKAFAAVASMIGTQGVPLAAELMKNPVMDLDGREVELTSLQAAQLAAGIIDANYTGPNNPKARGTGVLIGAHFEQVKQEDGVYIRITAMPGIPPLVLRRDRILGLIDPAPAPALDGNTTTEENVPWVKGPAIDAFKQKIVGGPVTKYGTPIRKAVPTDDKKKGKKRVFPNIPSKQPWK